MKNQNKIFYRGDLTSVFFFASVLLFIFAILLNWGCQKESDPLLPPPELEGTWTALPNMPTGRVLLASAVVNGKIYTIGGLTADRVDSKTVEMYDPATSTWTAKADMHDGRTGLVANEVDGIIYVIGGYQGVCSSVVPSLEAYDPTTDTWEIKSDMPFPRIGFESCVIDGVIYIVGGIIGGCSTLDTLIDRVDAYDTKTDTWTEKAPLPSPKVWLGACTVNGKLYTLGGIPKSFETPSNEVLEYTPDTDTWIKTTLMIKGKYGFEPATADGKIFVICGTTALGSPWYSNSVNAYDPGKNKWETFKNAPTERGFFTSCTINGEIYVIGGESKNVYLHEDAVIYATVEKFTP